MKLKVCGMKLENNISEISKLKPDFMGFIFWPKSKRFFNEKSIRISNKINKVGVFVNQDYDFIIDKINNFKLDFIQLHGEEDYQFCKKIKTRCKVIKVFNIESDFDFEILSSFESVCDYFLFDTKGDSYGGNGIKFDWKLLKKYPSKKPFLLSGGIDITDFTEILKIKELKIPLIGIDINSKFEFEPGLKNIKKVKELIKKMKK
jgi:phosphoribosylanthranilate isomerase